jgi:hypothetical protein
MKDVNIIKKYQSVFPLILKKNDYIVKEWPMSSYLWSTERDLHLLNVELIDVTFRK